MLIAQISDIHIRPQNELYKGVVDSNELFEDAIKHLMKLDMRPDLVLITGDLVDFGQPEEYQEAAKLLATLPIPTLLLPGNHDNSKNILNAFPHHRYLPQEGPMNYCVDDYPVRIIGLDITVLNEHHGFFSDSSKKWLKGILDANLLKPTLILMHQPPFLSGIPYMDEYRCFEGHALEALVKDYENIEAVLCGHVHRLMIHRWGNTVVIGCPSTATEIDLQFSSLARPQSYLGPHGYLLHYWNEDGRLITHLCNTDTQIGPYPFY